MPCCKASGWPDGDRRPLLIGVLSDTHGLLRPRALSALRPVEHILHAGDIGDPGILGMLGTIAPTTAIRGNIDRIGRCAALPPTDAVELGGALIYLVHSIHDLDLNPRAAGISVVVTGHSHSAEVRSADGVLYLNPGSAGPRRFRLPITLALLRIDPGQSPVAEIVEISR